MVRNDLVLSLSSHIKSICWVHVWMVSRHVIWSIITIVWMIVSVSVGHFLVCPSSNVVIILSSKGDWSSIILCLVHFVTFEMMVSRNEIRFPKIVRKEIMFIRPFCVAFECPFCAVVLMFARMLSIGQSLSLININFGLMSMISMSFVKMFWFVKFKTW